MSLAVETLARVAERSQSVKALPDTARKVFDTPEQCLTALNAQSMKGAGKVLKRITDGAYALRSASDGVYAVPLDSDGNVAPNGTPITDTAYWAE